MRLLLVLLLGWSALCDGTPTHQSHNLPHKPKVLSMGLEPRSKDPIDDYIRLILEMLRAKMPEGIPELGIPPLDPFAVPHFDIPHIDEPIAQVDVAIENLEIRNLSTFKTTQAHLDLITYSMQLGLAIDDLRGDANYVLDGTMFGIFPLFGNGPMWLEIYGLQLFAEAEVIINAGGFLEVSEMNITAEFEDIKMHLDDLMGGGDMEETINKILNTLGLTLWDQLKDAIFPLLDNLLIDVINDALSGCSITDLIVNGSCSNQYLSSDALKLVNVR